MDTTTNKTGLCCCFCNEDIESTDIDPCDVNILINWDKSKNKQSNQTFWCHFECFRESLHKSIQTHLVVHLLNNSNE